MFKRVILLLLVECLIFSTFADTRIKDIATVEGVRDNILIGSGLVVGLHNTGDNLQNSAFTKKGLTDLLERLGVNVQGTNNLKTKNVAAVTVSAKLPPFARQGAAIEVKVAAIGDAKSLRGGTLLATPLLGADGNVYAVAQGPIIIAEFNPSSDDVKTKSKTVETSGYIQSGAIVENEVDFRFDARDKVYFSLRHADFSTAVAVASAINDNVAGNTAKAVDPSTIEVNVPSYRKSDLIAFISEIEGLPVNPDYKAKIVIDESSGTVVIGDKVKIRPVAISQGNLMVNIGENNYDQQAPRMNERKLDQLNRAIDERRGKTLHQLGDGATLSDLVSGLNKMGVWPSDIINILYNMKSVGALDAEIEVR